MSMDPQADKRWSVYIIQCDDDALYTGISVDVERRFEQHRNGVGAKFFRTRGARRLVYIEAGHSRSSASRREVAIKQLAPAKKRKLLGSSLNQITDRR